MPGRRVSDKCSTNNALELVCSKAYECVLKAGEDTVTIEAAIEKCRELLKGSSHENILWN